MFFVFVVVFCDSRVLLLLSVAGFLCVWFGFYFLSGLHVVGVIARWKTEGEEEEMTVL